MKKNVDYNGIKMHVFSIVFILLVLIEFQIMINYPDQFIGFVGIGCLILIDVYLLISTSVKIKDEKYGRKDELFESISKSEKASYLLIKKCFQDLDERMDKIEKVASPISNVVALNEHNTQKAINLCMEENKKVAKIVIGRNKENAEALMNSNEEFKDRLTKFETTLSKMEKVILQADIAPVSQETINEGISQEQYEELLSTIGNLRNYIEEQMQQVLQLAKEPVIVEKVAESIPEPEVINEPTPEPEPEVINEPTSEPEVINEPTPEPEPEVEEEPEPEPIPEVAEEIPPMPDLSDPNKPMSPEDIAALLANMSVDTQPTPEPEVEEEPEPIPEVEEEPEPEPIPQPEQKEEIDDLFDPNKMMSPDDIAALLANMNVDTQPTPEPEPEVVEEPEPVIEEEKPPMPDLSDPNKIMSPEDIAALIANL